MRTSRCQYQSFSLCRRLTIGIGTMVGAGIFVFPGLAAANAGLAATLSFAIGGLIALLVALPTSELATAIPRSGGGYYFVSRGMGSAYGAIVEAADAFDTVVMGESDPSLATFVFGMPAD